MLPQLLYITSFLDLLATSLLVPFLPLHLQSIGLPRLLVGVFSSVYPSVQLFSSPAAGYCSDHYGLKFTLVCSLLLCSVLYYLLASTSSLALIFCCRVALGVLKHTQTLCKAVFVDIFDKEKHAKAFGVMGAAEALGFMVGPIVGAHFIETHNGFQHLCKITTFIFAVNALLVCFLCEEKSFNSEIGGSTKTNSKRCQNYKKNCKINWSIFLDIFVLKLFLCISLSLFYMNYALLVVEQFHESPSMVGYTNSFQGLICVVSSLVSGHVSTFYYSNYSYYVKLSHSFLVLSISFLCTIFVSNFVIFVFILIPLNSSSTLLRIYLTETLLSRSTLHNRGAVVGVENAIASVACLVSPFIFEIIAPIFGSSSIPFVTFSLTSLSAGFSAIFYLSNNTYLKKD